MDFITPIKAQLDENLHTLAKKHLELINTPLADSYQPRWFNFNSYEDGKLWVKSSISPKGFIIAIPKDLQDSYFILEYEHTEFWQQFKTYRTAFLNENYPNIKQFGI